MKRPALVFPLFLKRLLNIFQSLKIETPGACASTAQKTFVETASRCLNSLTETPTFMCAWEAGRLSHLAGLQ